MKKILFNDRYDLTKKVIDGQKTKTRRIAEWDLLCDMREDSIECIRCINILVDGRKVYGAFDAAGNPIGQAVSTYHIGEEVAVAQRYKDIYPKADFKMVGSGFMTESAGWSNKLFVRADLMPHRIHITGIRMERLQRITNKECLAEGVSEDIGEGVFLYWWGIDHRLHEDWRKISDELACHMMDGVPGTYFWDTPQKAFAVLFDRISGRGTWQKNPWVWVYEFELVK